MSTIEVSYMFLVLLSAAGTLVLAIFAWSKRKVSRGAMLAILLFAISWWGWTYAAESLWVGLAGKLFWAKMKYFGIVLTPVAMFGFAVQYARPNYRNPLRYILLLLIVPAITLVAVWTNPIHHQFYTAASLDYSYTPPVLHTEHGIFFWIHTAYSYVMLLLGTLYLADAAFHNNPIYRRQQWMILLAALVPWLANAVEIFGHAVAEVELTNVAFTVSGAAIYFAIFHFGLLDLMPIARNLVVENLLDGVLVLDPEDRILDINPVLCRWLNVDARQVVGQWVAQALPAQAAARLGKSALPSGNSDLEINTDGNRIILEVRASQVHSTFGKVTGRVLLLRDVTVRKQVERSLWQANELLERMFNSIDLLVVFADRDLRIQRVNRAFTEQVGRAPEELIGQPLFNLFPNPERETIFRDVLENGEVYSAYAEPLDPSAAVEGNTTFWNWSVQPVCSATGDVEGIVLSMINVTGRELASRALREALDLNQKIISTSSISILAFDATGQCILANEAAARTAGGSLEDVLRFNFHDLPDINGPDLMAAGDAVLETGKPQHGEYFLITPFGKHVWLECHLSTFLRAGKQHLLLLAQDISARREAEEELRRSEARFHSLVDSMNDPVFTLDKEGRHTGLYGRWFEQPGIAERYVLGRAVEEILGAEDALVHMEAHQRALRGNPVVFDWHVETENGTRYFENSLSPLWQDGEVVGVVGVGRDITVSKRLEAELEEAKALLEQAFQQSPAPMVLLSCPDGRVEMINPACQTALHLTQLDIVKNVSITKTAVPWVMYDKNGHALPREEWPVPSALRGATINGVEYQLKLPDEEPRWLLMSAAPVHNKAGSQIAALIVFIDITERKRFEQVEREQRLLAEAYRDTAEVLNSTIDLDAVLNLVLNNIGQVTPHDAAQVLLVDEAGNVIKSRFTGYSIREQAWLLERARVKLRNPGAIQRLVKRGTVLIEDVQTSPVAQLEGPVFERMRAFVDLPIRFNEQLLGVLTLGSETPGFYTEAEAARLEVFADQAAIAIENARLYAAVEHLTMTDDLTRLYNFRGLFELGQREFDRARRFHRSLSVMFFNVDHFGNFNKQYTHAVGNEVLQSVARSAQSVLRGVDLIARYGGEEFVVLLPETNLSTTVQVAERVRAEIAGCMVPTRFGALCVTVSVGVAELSEDVPTLEMLIDRANHAEHHAKEEGRNRVVTYPRNVLTKVQSDAPADGWSI